MSQPIRQPSFAGGILSPSLWARTEYEKYAVGARDLLNFIITPHGAAANRCGTLLVDDTKDDAAGRLRDFTFSTGDTLLLCFTAGKIRFYTRDVAGFPGVIESAPGVALEVDTPYALEDLPKIRQSQLGDVVYVTCAGRDPYALTRTAVEPLAFTFVPMTFDVPAPNGVVYMRDGDGAGADVTHPLKQWSWLITEIWQDQAGLIWETSPSPVAGIFRYDDSPTWDAGTTYALGETVDGGGHAWFASKANGNINHVTSNPVWWDGPFSSHPAPSTVTPLPTELVLYPDKVIHLDAPEPWGLTVSTGAQRLARRVYRGRGELFGYVGEFEGTTFTDVGDMPDFTLTPPTGRNPFHVYDAAGALVRTEKPAVVARHDQRLVMGRTSERAGFVFFSRVDDDTNFDEHAILIAEDSFELSLAGGTWQEVRAFVSGTALLAFTSSGEWALGNGRDGGTMSALDYGAHERTHRGSSWVEPVKTGDDEVLFFPAVGNMLRELALDGDTRKYAASDLTIVSKHLFKGRTIVDRAWQEEPWSVLWVVLDDGTLLSLTFIKEHQIVAWTRHETQGAVESACAVREGTEDALYLIVRRTIGGVTKRFIERMASRATVEDAALGLFLDSAQSYIGEPASHFANLGHLEGCTVNALADGYVVRGLVVEGGAIDLPADSFPDGASVVHVGLPFVADFEALDLAPTQGRNRVKVVKSVTFEYEGSRGGFVGQDFTKRLEEWRQRTVAHGFGAIPLESGSKTIPIDASWNSGGRVVIRQVDPLPLTILAVSREVEFGGNQG